MTELLTVIAIIAIVSGIVVIGLKAAGGSRQRDQTLVTLDRMSNALVEITNAPGGAQKLYTIQLPNIYFPEQTNNFPNSNYKNWIGVPAGSMEAQLRSARVIGTVLATNPSAKQFLNDLPVEKKIKLTFKSPLTARDEQYTVPLDAWGNPIVFVFDGLQIGTGTGVGRPFTVDLGGGVETEVGGLTNIYSQADKTYYEPASALTPTPSYNAASVQNLPNPQADYTTSVKPMLTGYNPRIAPMPDANNNPVREYTLRSPDHRPFWMSAGPDGKYETNDDNVYSFQH